MSKSILKNTLYKFSLSVFNIIIPVLVGPYINWLLGVEQVSLYNSANTMLTFFLIFATFGIYNFGVRETSRIKDDKAAVSALFTNLFCFGLITSLLTALGYGLYTLLAVPEKQQGVFALMLIQILANIFMVEWLNEALENYGFIAKKTMLIRCASTVFLFLTVTHPDDVMIYAGLMSVTVLANNLTSFIYIKRQIPFAFSAVRLGRYIKPLLLMLIIANINYLYTQVDRLFLKQLDLEGIALTQYTLPSNLINMVLVVVQSLLVASVPRLSYYLAQGNEEGYSELLAKSSRSYFLLVYPVCIGLFCLSYEAMYLYGSVKWADATAPVLRMFALRCIVTSVYTIFTNQILYLKGQEKAMVKILGFGGLVNVIADTLLLVSGRLTPVSAIASTGLAELLMLSVMYGFIRRRMKVDFRLFSLKNMKYLLASLLFIPAAWGIRKLGLGILPTAILTAGICGGYYFGLLLLTKDEMLFFFLQKIFGKRLNR